MCKSCCVDYFHFYLFIFYFYLLYFVYSKETMWIIFIFIFLFIYLFTLFRVWQRVWCEEPQCAKVATRFVYLFIFIFFFKGVKNLNKIRFRAKMLGTRYLFVFCFLLVVLF